MLVPADVWTVAKAQEGNAVLIRPTGQDVAVPIFIDQGIAHSILIGMGNVKVPRPLTHDLFLSALDQLEIHVSRIEITEIKDQTFYARLVLREHDSKEVVIDSRPSDCIALAVRVKCPIFIDEEVVSSAGISVNQVAGGEDEVVAVETPTSGVDSELKRLHQELDEAVQEENYEEAARLRDRIQEIEA